MAHISHQIAVETSVWTAELWMVFKSFKVVTFEQFLDGFEDDNSKEGSTALDLTLPDRQVISAVSSRD